MSEYDTEVWRRRSDEHRLRPPPPSWERTAPHSNLPSRHRQGGTVSHARHGPAVHRLV